MATSQESAVRIAAGLEATADPGEAMVPAPVKDPVEPADRGLHQLKDRPGK